MPILVIPFSCKLVFHNFNNADQDDGFTDGLARKGYGDRSTGIVLTDSFHVLDGKELIFNRNIEFNIRKLHDGFLSLLFDGDDLVMGWNRTIFKISDF